MAFQTNTFQNNAFQICAATNLNKYRLPDEEICPEDEEKQILLRLKRRDEEEEEILLEYKRREELGELVAKIARDKKEQDEIMEMLMALLLANEA